MSKKLSILLGIVAALVGSLFFLKYSSWVTSFVWSASGGGAWLLPLVAVSALLDSVNPCAFSVLLITIAFLFSLGKPRNEVLKLGASYIGGLFLAYLLIGLGLLQALHIVGVLVALCEFPCTGGPYLMVLGLLHDSQTYLFGFGYLIFYNLLFILPLVVILLVASHKELLDKVNAWRKDETKKLKIWLGLAMVALGIIILFFV